MRDDNWTWQAPAVIHPAMPQETELAMRDDNWT